MCIKIQPISMARTICWIQYTKKNVAATKSHNEYKDVLLNKKFWDIQWIGLKVNIIE